MAVNMGETMMVVFRHNARDPGTTTRDVEAAGIPMKLKAAGSETRKVSRLRRLLIDYPFHSAAMLAPLTASIVISAGAGLTLARGLVPGLAANMPAVTLAVAGLTFSLTATLTISTLRALGEIKEDIKAWRNEGRSANAHATEHDAEQHLTLGAVESLTERVADLTTHLITRMSAQGPQIEVRKNCSDAWVIARGSEYMAVHGSLRLDVEKKRGPTGVRYEFDLMRIRQIHLPRYARDGAGRVTIIIPSPRDGEQINEANLTHLLLFRKIEQVAAEDGVEVDFSKVQFALVDGPISQKAFFVGARLVGGQPTGFVNSYTDWYNALQVPRTMVDDLVEVTMDTSIVEAYRNTARAIIDRAAVYSYEELEERFAEHLPPRGFRAKSIAPEAAQFDPATFVTTGDHFVWPNPSGGR